MCGIAGFISLQTNKVAYADKKNFCEDALYISALRGMDGTGIALIREPTGPAQVFKRALSSPDFLQLRTAGKLLSDVDSARAVLLHTRSSTRGSATDANCHPFQVDHITLIHNGTVHNHRALAPDCQSDVDSAHIAHAFAKSPELEVLEKIYGDYCFVWHNSKEGTLNIARNGGRPMYYTHIPAWNGIAFMSEHIMLAAILARNDIKIKDQYYYPAEHTLLQIDLKTTELTEKLVPFDPPSARARGPTTEASAAAGHTGGKTDMTTVRGPTGETRKFSKNIIKAIFESRKIFTAQWRDKLGKPTTDRQLRKAQTKLRSLALKLGTPYGAIPITWIPYVGFSELGFVVAHLEGSIHAQRAVIIHNIEKEFYVDDLRSDDYVFVVPYQVHQVNKEIGAVLAELDEDTYFEFPKDAGILDGGKDEEETGSDMIELVRGPHGHYITHGEFKRLTEHGCGLCTGVCSPDFSEFMEWAGDLGTDPICHECSGLMEAADQRKVQ